jgi:putative transposase
MYQSYWRSKTLWEGRFKSCLVQSEDYILGCYRYIEMNPVRASMVEHPAEYRWSSYGANAQGEENLLLDPHEAYLELGESDKLRNIRYRELFRYSLTPGMVDEIRVATNGNYALGNELSSGRLKMHQGVESHQEFQAVPVLIA